jgi:hypothetical protein
VSKRYVNHPEKVMSEYGLSDEEKEWVRTGNTEKINENIGESSSAVVYIDIPR